MRMQPDENQFDKSGVLAGIVGGTPIPKMARVGQIFDRDKIDDIPSTIRSETARADISGTIKPGARVAITVGSRGIANLPLLVRSLADAIRSAGGNPFVVPAMGSHGGATAAGQLEVLEGMGVTEKSIDAPICSSMETVIVGETADRRPVHIDRMASEADGIVVFGRVKPHTAFRGSYESGIFKMMAIGLANQHGAETVHAEGFGNMARNIVTYGEAVLAHAHILFALAVVENAYHDTCGIVALTPNEIPSREPELLQEARKRMPAIRFDPIDVMIVDQIGKNHSGDGMDPNVTGSYATPYATGGPETQRYVVLDISEESHGSAIGAGMASFSTKRLFDKIDLDATYANALTARGPQMGRIPIILANDRLAIQAAIYCCVDSDTDHPRIVRIASSSDVDEILISEVLFDELGNRADLKVLQEPAIMEFDSSGNLF